MQAAEPGLLSRYTRTMLRVGRPRIRILSPGEDKKFSFLNSQNWLWSPSGFLPVATKECSLGEKQQERDGNDLTPSGVESKNA